MPYAKHLGAWRCCRPLHPRFRPISKRTSSPCSVSTPQKQTCQGICRKAQSPQRQRPRRNRFLCHALALQDRRRRRNPRQRRRRHRGTNSPDKARTSRLLHHLGTSTTRVFPEAGSWDTRHTHTRRTSTTPCSTVFKEAHSLRSACFLSAS